MLTFAWPGSVAFHPISPFSRLSLSSFTLRATTGVYWQADGMFNGMLFKDFVLDGFMVRLPQTCDGCCNMLPSTTYLYRMV